MMENANGDTQKNLIEKLKSLAGSYDPVMAPKDISNVVQSLLASGMDRDTIAIQAGLTMQYLSQVMADGTSGDSLPKSRGWEFSIQP